jgi:[calcium/calmodulin-dependent protein kinase] kinase
MELVKKGAVLSKTYWREESVNIGDLDNSDESPSRKIKRILEESKARKYFRQLILGLDYSNNLFLTAKDLVHNYANVIHRDIKPENLLITENDVLKISDFGVSHLMEENASDELKTDAGTKCFLAPEAWQGKIILAYINDRRKIIWW